MALSDLYSTKDLERQSKAAFEGKVYKVFLATAGALTEDSTAAAWTAVEVSGNGYAAVTGTIGAGTYNTANGWLAHPVITAAFTATGAGFTYDTVCIQIDNGTYLFGCAKATPAVSLLAGQTKTYTIQIVMSN